MAKTNLKGVSAQPSPGPCEKEHRTNLEGVSAQPFPRPCEHRDQWQRQTCRGFLSGCVSRNTGQTWRGFLPSLLLGRVRSVISGKDVDEAQIVPKSFSVLRRLQTRADFGLQACEIHYDYELYESN